MPDVLLSLVVPVDVAEAVEDLLLCRPDLVRGFTTGAVDGHGASVPLLNSGELVSGHSPRLQIQMVGGEGELRRVLALIREQLPRANIFYWLVPVMESGRIR